MRHCTSASTKKTVVGRFRVTREYWNQFLGISSYPDSNIGILAASLSLDGSGMTAQICLTLIVTSFMAKFKDEKWKGHDRAQLSWSTEATRRRRNRKAEGGK